MPIYEYSCGKCGAHLEVFQKISDKPLARHAKCGGKLSKEWSQTSFQLKGSGWYVTDYAGQKKPEAEGKDTKAEASPAQSTGGEKSADQKAASAATSGD